MKALKISVALALALLAGAGGAQAQQRVKVAINATPSPIGGYNPQTKVFEGIAVELMRVVAKESALELEFVPMPAGEQLAALTAKKVDIIAGDIGPTPDVIRQKIVDFSDTYGMVRDVLVVKTGSKKEFKATSDLKGLKVATLKGSPYADALAKVGASVKAYDTSREVLAAVEAGAVEGAVYPSHQAKDALKDNARPALMVVDSYAPPLLQSELAYVVQAGNIELLDKINAPVQKHLNRTTVDNLAKKWGVTAAMSTISEPCLCAP